MLKKLIFFNTALLFLSFSYADSPSFTPRRTTKSVSANFSIPNLTRDYILTVDTSGGSINIFLPDSVASNGLCADVKNIGSPANPIDVAAHASQTIDGSLTSAITGSGDSNRYCAINGNWINN